MEPFHFKEFTIEQDKAAMKVGTDGVLLGSWCSIENTTDSILDIGSGTGLISLMLAQRSDAMTIDAVEIDEDSYEQTVENFEASDWGDRLFCYNASFEEFAEEISEEEETYDLIVSNPPFYNDDIQTENESRNKARFTSSLPFEKLIQGVALILSKNGIFSVIIPKKEEKDFRSIAKKHNLFLHRMCNVKGNSKATIKRVLLEFSKTKHTIKSEELIIEKQRHQYTKEYINLTQDFYLNINSNE